MVETINHSNIDEHMVPACCRIVGASSKVGKVVCNEGVGEDGKSKCNVKVCWFRDKAEKKEEKEKWTWH